MKKILALVLALVMVLTVATAMATSSPKDPSDTTSTTTSTSTSTSTGTSTTTNTTTGTPKKTEPYWTTETKQDTITLKILPSPTKSVKEIIKNLEDTGIKGFDSGIQGQLNGFSTISEIVAAMFVGNTATVTSDLEAKIKFESVLPKSQDAKVVIMNLTNSDTVVYNGQTTDDGQLTMTFPAGKVRELANNVFAMIVVTK